MATYDEFMWSLYCNAWDKKRKKCKSEIGGVQVDGHLPETFRNEEMEIRR